MGVRAAAPGGAARHVLRRVTAERSLVFFYTKEGQPISDAISRLVVGVGRVTKVGRAARVRERREQGAPIRCGTGWSITRSAPTGPTAFFSRTTPTSSRPAIPTRTPAGASCCARSPSRRSRRTCARSRISPSTRPPDVALSTLVRCLDAVRKIRQHGIAEGPWEAREEWLNEQIARTWIDRGAFPGLGSALEALGMRLGTALALELIGTGALASDADPWPVVDALLRGEAAPPQPGVRRRPRGSARHVGQADARAASARSSCCRDSRLTPEQAKRWFDAARRNAATTGRGAPIARSSTTRTGSPRPTSVIVGDPAVSVGVDRPRALPGRRGCRQVPGARAIASRLARRSPPRAGCGRQRARAVRREEGDSLLSAVEVLDANGAPRPRAALRRPARLVPRQRGLPRRASSADSRSRCRPDGGWLAVVVQALQLEAHADTEERLARTLAQAGRARPCRRRSATWRDLLVEAITASGADGRLEQPAPRRCAARSRRRRWSASRRDGSACSSAALEPARRRCSARWCAATRSRRTGCCSSRRPARPACGCSGAPGDEASTIAQFLYRLGRYDGARQRPLFTGDARLTARRRPSSSTSARC